MSTCPNKDVFSAYIDGEIFSPWKEKLEEHLQTCVECRKLHIQYTAIHNRMQALDNAYDFDPEQSFERLCAKRTILKEARLLEEKKKAFNNPKNWFSSSIRIPVPAAAAAVLVFVLVPLLLFFKMEDTVVAARSSFTPILPVSLEKQKNIAEIDFCSLHADGFHECCFPTKAVVLNTKMFPVSEFTRLYSENGRLFQYEPSTVNLKISFSRFPFVTNYQLLDIPTDNISMINHP